MKAAFIFLLLLTACGPTGTGPDAVCEREAENDPVVKELVIRQGGNSWLAFNDPDALNNARARAKRACLARLGQAPAGGGVESVRPPSASYRGLF